MAEAMRALQVKQTQFKNMVSQPEYHFLMYGQYNLEIAEGIIESLNGMIKKQSSLKYTMKVLNMKLSSIYLGFVLGPSLHGFQSHLYIQAMFGSNANMFKNW